MARANGSSEMSERHVRVGGRCTTAHRAWHVGLLFLAISLADI